MHPCLHFQVGILMFLIIISPFTNRIFFFSCIRTVLIQEAKLFLNGRQKHMDNYCMLAKVLVFTHLLKTVCDTLNEIINVFKNTLIVLWVRMTCAWRSRPLADPESCLTKLKTGQIWPTSGFLVLELSGVSMGSGSYYNMNRKNGWKSSFRWVFSDWNY